MSQEREVMEVAVEAGYILLENGAEIFRVEDTINRICRHYGIDCSDVFTFSNGMFVTAGDEKEQYFAKVKHIPVSSSHLDRVAAVNQLSREIEADKYTIGQVKQCLKEIRNMPEKNKAVQILASGISCAAFCYLYGGNLGDSISAFAAGFMLHIFKMGISRPHMSKIVANISGGALVTLICVVLYKLNLGQHLNHMVVGSIMPLVPGVAFTNAIRDIADENYIAGAVRMLDALLVFFCIAMGVGFVFTVYNWMTGGILL